MLSPQLAYASNSVSASDFIKSISKISNSSRELEFKHSLLAGLIPEAHKNLSPISIEFSDLGKKQRRLQIFVTLDYLSIGTNEDNIRVPLYPTTSQALADEWNCVLPTTKLVKIIWEASKKIPPEPWGPPYDASMLSTNRIVKHNEKIKNKISQLGFNKTDILGGHKKDIVITNKLASKPSSVAIFGWHQLDGTPIQPLYLGHSNDYADYSHGTRLVSKLCILDGQEYDITKIMQDKNLAHSVSNEGCMNVIRQP